MARAEAWADQSRWRGYAYEFLWFGLKQGWVCLFGGAMLVLLVGTHLLWPVFWPETGMGGGAPVARYDVLVIGALIIQGLMLAFKLESWEEARVIFLFHVAGTIMELFKTYHGSWLYPEDSLLRIGAVPLFSGFMYAAVGSYIARVQRISISGCGGIRRCGRPGFWRRPSMSTSSPITGCRT